MTKYDTFVVRFKPEDGKRVRQTASTLEMTPPEFIRACVTTEIARKTGDPAALEALSNMFRQGVDEWIRERIDFEVAKQKKEHEKKRV